MIKPQIQFKTADTLYTNKESHHSIVIYQNQQFHHIESEVSKGCINTLIAAVTNDSLLLLKQDDGWVILNCQSQVWKSTDTFFT